MISMDDLMGLVEVEVLLCFGEGGNVLIFCCRILWLVGCCWFKY